MFRNSVSSSQKTQCIFITECNWLMLFSEIITVCSEKHKKTIYVLWIKCTGGPAMAHVVSCWPVTAEARVHDQVGPCGVCGGQSDTGTVFLLSSSIFHCLYHMALLTHIMWGMNNRPVDDLSSEILSDMNNSNNNNSHWD
jgi:hypothetical protein